MGSTNKSFVGSNYCGLCRSQFPLESLEGADAWQSKFRAVLLLDSNDEKSIEITNTASLADTHSEIDVSLLGHTQSKIVTICRSQQLVNVERPPEGPAFCFHDWCYSILIWKLRRLSEQIIRSVVYKLVRSLLPNSSVWRNICEARQQLDSTHSLQTIIAHADIYPTMLQPKFMPSLPPEVRSRIWEFVGLSTPSSALVIVAGEISHLILCITSRPNCDLPLEIGCRLSIESTRIFGIDYICRLFIEKPIEKPYIGPSTVLGDATGLKFVSSISGICAIKMVGIGWETDWLGKIPGVGYVWYGMIQDIDIPLLCFTYNDLNCVNISKFGPSIANLILCDNPNMLSTLIDPDATLSDFKRRFIGPGRPATLKYNTRFLRYLSLYNDAKYISGLTVYHTTSGIVGLEAHFMRMSQLSGCRDGCALYFPLCPEERIAYTWLRIVNSSIPIFYRLALTIQTTLGRTHTFGPYILPGLVKDTYKWVLLKGRGCVSGFYYENPISNITTLGITDDDYPPVASSIIPQYPQVFSPFPGPNGGIFLSIASFGAFKRVDLCRVSDRCIGILIHYINGQSAVLGQWRTGGIASRSCIYDNDSTSCTNVYFIMASFGEHKIVTDIIFSEDTSKLGPETEYHNFDLQQKIAWWFSETWDAIIPWKGELIDIPDESKGCFPIT